VYHHRLENALDRATANKEVVKRIMKLLFHFAKGVSYGLPIGGPAARLLAELVLNRVDRLLLANGITFCRFVDDYHLFANSKEEAHEHLVFLCDKLLDNEGLSLQKSKTQILSAAEFLSTVDFHEFKEGETEGEQVTRSFMSLHLHYDPYSETAEEDYDALRKELAKFDVVAMLSREVHKMRIDQPITKKLIRAVKHLSVPVQNAAAISLIENLPVLYPVFPTAMMVLRDIVSTLDARVQQRIFSGLRALVTDGSYILRVPTNMAFAVRVLKQDLSDETDEVLVRIYDTTTSKIVKRDVILSMVERGADYWLSDKRKHYGELTSWEKRALLIGSYVLGDEGAYWRTTIKTSLSPVDALIMSWAAEKKNRGDWRFPL
jgi:hypothetical protein